MERYIFPREKRAALESLRQPFAVYQFMDKRVVALLLSDGFCELFGYADREAALRDMDNNMYKDAHPDDAARVADAAIRFATEGGRYEAVYRTRKPGGSDYRIVHAMGEHVRAENGARLAQVWYTDEGDYADSAAQTGLEITETLSGALREQSLVNASRYDYLTGLPNMTYFFELSESGKESIRRRGDQPMLLYIDFSGMKFFNARYGFAAGDQILRAFTAQISRAFGSENCCRIGADHFAAITGAEALEDRLSRIFREFGALYDGKTPPVHVGIYPYGIENVPVSIACDRAKLACSAIGGSYVSGFRYYNNELREDALLRRHIVESFDTALRERWIQVYLQPIIRAVNERVSDVEALARWIDPERGMLSPAAFIPALEEAGLIYRLDLYMLDRVLETIRAEMAEGFFVVPHSINLSRSDFDACDIVEEIRTRVDAAGVSRDRITIEITESVIGSDFEFMREQIERFRSLGFPVWMDDFGSGYSSLDVLQSIKFDLLKFDMSFMRRLNEGDGGRVILTELMRMATSLGVDTVCEGVETEAQARFLREIGCSKLQGYYYSKPVPYRTIQEKHQDKTLIETENPDETAYYESVGRVNLFDLGVIASEEKSALQNTFNTIPIGILEMRDGQAWYLRTNRSFQDFCARFLGIEILQGQVKADATAAVGYGATFLSVMRQCCTSDTRLFFDEKTPNGSVVHAFARRIRVNPVTGSVAIAIAVLSVTEPDGSDTYADIARSLAADYYNIFVIDLDTDRYIEYSSRAGDEDLSIERHGEGFFESARRDAQKRVYEEDRARFLQWFTRENVLRELDAQGAFTITYRLIDSGTPVYVSMKVSRMRNSSRIILGISVVDAQMKQKQHYEQLQKERELMVRLRALSEGYLSLFTVDPKTGNYVEYSSSEDFDSLGAAKDGDDFFGQAYVDAFTYCFIEDRQRFQEQVTLENVLREIALHGRFSIDYRLIIKNIPRPVTLKAALFRDGDQDKLVVGVRKWEAADDEKEKYRLALEDAYEKAWSATAVYARVAQALARGCMDLYYVNMDTDEFIEFHTDDDCGVLTEARRGADFFAGCPRDAKLYVHAEDQEAFVRAMNRAFLTERLKQSRVFEMTYRRIKEGTPFYVRMRVTRADDDARFIVLAVSNIDEQMKQRRTEERIQEERVIYARLHAITGNFICVYVVDPETSRYREFSATPNYEECFAQEKDGEDFFASVRESARAFTHPHDIERFLAAFTRENVLEAVRRNGIFTWNYRLMMDGRPVHVQMKAAMVEEKEGPRLIVGLNDIDAQVRQKEEYGRRLAQAQIQANLDALTGVRNRHAFLEMEASMDRRIEERSQTPFAVVMLDVNDLKKVNDTDGHQAGDRYLCDASRIICETFKHSPVFRVGGDEFAVLAQGSDYTDIEQRLAALDRHNESASHDGGIVIACGMAKYENDASVAAVFARADKNMYENKNALKFVQGGQDA